MLEVLETKESLEHLPALTMAAEILNYTVEKYLDFQSRNEAVHLKSWPLADSPFPTLLLCAAYVISATVLGPQWMANRKPPYGLKRVMMVYNVAVVALNVWLFSIAATNYATRYSLTCEPVTPHDAPHGMSDAAAVYWFYISKLVDFIDTAFLVLNKKNVSMLHLIHHGSMPFSGWIGVKYAPGGHSMFLGLANTFVHVVMYSYYFLAALGPSIRPYLWWKKYLTTLQLVQFVIIFLHSMQLFFIPCDYPIGFIYYQLFFAALFFALFANFYLKTYIVSVKTHKTQ